jgi:hypothetical protein
MNPRNPESLQEAVKVVNKKTRIFEIDEEPQVDGNRQGKHQSPVKPGFGIRHPSDQMEVHKSGSEDDKNEFGSAPAVKEDAAHKGYPVPETPGNQVIA